MQSIEVVPEANSNHWPKHKWPSAVVTMPPYTSIRHNRENVRAASRAHSIARTFNQCIDGTTRQLLYLTEFVILIEYVEVIISAIYSIYLEVCFRLPNRKYHPQLSSVDATQLASITTNVLVYALLEFISLLVLSLLLHNKLSVPPIYQLAFVLEKQWWLVQFKLTFWMMFTVLQTLEHAGADYSFQFKWLKRVNDA